MPVLVYTYVMDILYIVLFCLEHGIAPMVWTQLVRFCFVQYLELLE